jgi:cob(I)alamin adenosyltransferase
MPVRGYVQVYTGDGKGKTTAAIGLAVRAIGAGKRVLFLQFMKTRSYSEHSVLERLSPALTLVTLGKPFFLAKEGTLSEDDMRAFADEVVIFAPGQPPEDYRKAMADGVERAKKAVSGGEYDVVILDEIIVAAYYELVSDDQIVDILSSRLDSVELVLTGRGASDELVARADLVTTMQNVKHYYDRGILARAGVDC